jgi:hypothetical protein
MIFSINSYRVSLCVFSVVLLVSSAPASLIKWENDISKLDVKRFTTPKPTLVFLYNGKAAQEKVVSTYWDQHEVIEVSKEFHMGSLNVKDPKVKELALRHEVYRVPAILFYYPDGATAGALPSNDLTHRNLIMAMCNVALEGNKQLEKVSPRDYLLKLGISRIDLKLLGRTSYISGVGKYGDGRAIYKNRNIFIIGTTKDDIGKVVAFKEIKSRGGRYYEAEYDEESTGTLAEYFRLNPPVLPFHAPGGTLSSMGADGMDAGEAETPAPLVFPGEKQMK